MAESGFFRGAFRGFNKQDVLQYIDELQTSQGERLTEAEVLRAQAQEALAKAQEQASADAARADELEKANAALAEQVEKLTALAQIYKTELLALRDQKLTVDQAQEKEQQLAEALEKNRVLEEQCALLREQNARYADVVGDVSRLVVEARVVSASYLDAAQQKSTECIQQLDVFLSALKGQVEKVREDALANRRAGDDRIESLLSDLQELGGTLGSPTDK